MANTEKRIIELTISRLETKIDTYKRLAKEKKRQAFIDVEYGDRESEQLNKGQQFALEYIIDDLQIILDTLKNT